MKKLLLIITVLFFGISTANAQIEKASEGTIYEVMFTPNFDSGAQFALQESHFVRRDFNGDGTATRYKVHVSFESVDGGEDTMTLGAMYGKRNTMKVQLDLVPTQDGKVVYYLTIQEVATVLLILVLVSLLALTTISQIIFTSELKLVSMQKLAKTLSE